MHSYSAWHVCLIVAIYVPRCLECFAVFLAEATCSPHVRESGIRNPAIFFLLESGIQKLESGIHNGLESGITALVWNPESRRLESEIQRVGIQNPDAGIWNLEAGIRKPRTFVDSLTWGETCCHNYIKDLPIALWQI